MTFEEQVLRLFAEGEAQELLHWQVVGGELEFLVHCDGLFGVDPDCELITPTNLALLEQVMVDVLVVTGNDVSHIPHLFAARLRNRRPDNSRYPSDSRLWPLFDATGSSEDPGMPDPAADVAELATPVPCHPPVASVGGPDHCGLCGTVLAPPPPADWPSLATIAEGAP